MLFLPETCVGQQASLKSQCLSISGHSDTFSNESSTWRIQQSIGQGSVIGTYGVQRDVLRQGFIQPSVSGTRVSCKPEIGLLVYPNPFSSSLQLEFDAEIMEQATLELFDISGKLLHIRQFNPSFISTIQLPGIEPGSFILRVTAAGQVFSQPVQKQ
jgi:hypothetical protein